MAEKLRFVDAHVHFWDLAKGWYPALVNDSPPTADRDAVDSSKLLNRNFMPANYLDHSRRFDVAKMVHVTCAQTPPSWPDETRFLQDLCDAVGYPNAIIGWTDFLRPIREIDVELGLHTESTNFRGVRHHGGIDYNSGHTARCFDVMQRLGLIYDTVAHQSELPAAATLAQRFDGMTFVLEHTGWPSALDADVFDVWRLGMRQFAEAPNTAVKISGLGMVKHDWTLDDIRPWVETTIEIFGPDRCMFASNFPVDWLYSDYDTLLNTYVALTAEYSDSERADLFGGSAERWYRI
jgi:predicted TIM-barrel fold metal-dependent hydrolase